MKKSFKYLLTLLVIAALIFGTVHRGATWLPMVGTIIFGAIGVVLTSFVLIYSRRPWHSSPYGRALMYSKIGFASIIIFSFTVKIVEAIQGHPWVWAPAGRVVLFTVVLASQIRLVCLLVVSKENSEEERHE